MKMHKPAKAPVPPGYDMKKNYMKESDKGSPRKSAQAPMTKKRLSK
jgi:hypothetical protein